MAKHGGPVPAKQTGQILSLGSINADFQMRTARRPEVSETLMARDFVRLSGGKAANVAYLARKLGVEALLFGHVGEDELAGQALSPLQEIGVDLSGVRKVPGMSTGVAVITVPPDGKKGIVLAANANQAWTAEDAAPIENALRLAGPQSVLVIDCEIPALIVEQAMKAARAHGIRIILDPSPASGVEASMLQLADIIVPNSGEAKHLSGIDCSDAQSAARAARRLHERGAAIVCVKLPDGGCVMLEDSRLIHVAAVPVEVVDTSGAGDAFAGALAVALLEGRSHAEALRFAVAASHVAITAYGSQPGYPGRQQIDEMEKRLGPGHAL